MNRGLIRLHFAPTSQMSAWFPWRRNLPLRQQTRTRLPGICLMAAEMGQIPNHFPLLHGSQAGATEADVQPGHAVTLSNIDSCTWVRRGKDWIWGDQDGGEVGKLTGSPYWEAVPNGGTKLHSEGWHRVKWTATGITALYRIGAQGCYDLEVATEKLQPQWDQLHSRYTTSSNQAAIYPQWAFKKLGTLEPPRCCRPFTKECQGISREQLQQGAVQNIPAGTSFGIELELLFPDEAGGIESVKQALQHAGLQGPWGVGHDKSIKGSGTALEVVSPPLQGLDGLLQVYQAMEALHVLRPGVNKSTGLHIHVGCDLAGGWELSHLKDLAYNCVMLEAALDEVMPMSRCLNEYCSSLHDPFIGTLRKSQACTDPFMVYDRSPSAFAAFAAVVDGMLNRVTLTELAPLINPSQAGDYEDRKASKYYRVNLLAIEEHGTVEFRQPPGTTSPGLVVAYVLLYLRLVEASQKTRVSGGHWDDLMKLCSGDDLLCNWLVRRREEIAIMEKAERDSINDEEEEDVEDLKKSVFVEFSYRS